MGADLLVSCVSIKGKPNKEYRKVGIGKDIKERTKKMVDRLDKYTAFVSNQWVEFFEFINGEEVPEDEEIKKRAKGTIQDFATCGDRRDVTFLTFPERTLILAGGMSWGDSPTEGYNIVQRFSLLPRWLLNIGGFK